MMKYIVSAVAWTTGMLTTAVLVPLGILGLSIFNKTWGSVVGRLVSRGILAGFLIRVRCRGREKVDPRRTHLFMANHASFFDFFLLGGYLPGTTRGLEAAEHFSWPVWGTFLRRAGMTPIDRSNPRESLKSIARAAEQLREGVSILILPESTRTVDGRMLPFKKLPFKLAKKGGTDLVPVGLVGTFGLKTKKSWLIRPTRVEVRFGDPIPAEVVEKTDLDALAAMTRERITELLQ